MGNHELYMRRRKPDTIEVQQMKAQNKEEKLAKQQEREKLQREIAAREKAEKIQAEYEERLNSMQADMESRQKSLIEAQEKIRKLEDALRETQEAKQELEKGREDLAQMMERLRADQAMEAEEKARLEEEINAKAEENMLLQSEMAEARRKHEEATQALIEATTTPRHHHVQENDDDELDDEENNMNGEHSTDLRDNDDEINDPVDDRLTLAERNERLQNQLRSLKDELSHTTVESGETTMDRIHKENVKQGRDKYKTLREVRKGNTKRRVDQFENM